MTHRSTSRPRLPRQRSRRSAWLAWYRTSPRPRICSSPRDVQLAEKKTDLDRYIYLINLLDHDERSSTGLSCRTHRASTDRVRSTIGEACLKSATSTARRAACIFRSRGAASEGHLEELAQADVRSSASLTAPDSRLGDLAQMAWPFRSASLQLYTAAAGVPAAVPVRCFDAGTNTSSTCTIHCILACVDTPPTRNYIFSSTSSLGSPAGIPKWLHPLRGLDGDGRCASAPALPRQVLRL